MAARSPGWSIQSAALVVLLLGCAAIESIQPLRILQRPYHEATSDELMKFEARSNSVAAQLDQATIEAVPGQGAARGNAPRSVPSSTPIAHRARLR